MMRILFIQARVISILQGLLNLVPPDPNRNSPEGALFIETFNSNFN